MKRFYDDEEHERQELEEGEEQEDYAYPVAGPSVFPLLPPPPPPLLRLVVHHSSQNPSSNLLPPRYTLALIQETTTIGRDKSYEPRIRLKTLEVSRTHATIFQQQDGIDSDSESGAGQWFIVDNASTHGTFIRRYGEEQYTRLSEKGQSSLPRQLKHLDTVKVANQRFIVHLHGAEEGGTCKACHVNEDRSNVLPLLEDASAGSTAASTSTQSFGTGSSMNHAPMDEKTAKTFSKEEKRQNFRTNMQSLRKNLLASGGGGGGGAAPRSSNPKVQEPTTRNPSATTSGDDSSTATLDEAPRYVDRAKLRRSIHPPQHGLSDADPPHSSKRSRLSSPSSHAIGPTAPAEPSYGPGAALFQKMMQGDSASAQGSMSESGGPVNSTDGPRAEYIPKPKEVRMGKVIEVRTMAERTAGLGSGAVREGVEQHGAPADWRDVARQRRWREANR